MEALAIDTREITPRVVYGTGALTGGAFSLYSDGTGAATGSPKLPNCPFYLYMVTLAFDVGVTGTLTVLLDNVAGAGYDVDIFQIDLTGQTSIILPRDDAHWQNNFEPMLIPWDCRAAIIIAGALPVTAVVSATMFCYY
ncbi:MAG: hypothetical protein WC449_05515 [Candidatus Paceibacterota bacterium]